MTAHRGALLVHMQMTARRLNGDCLRAEMRATKTTTSQEATYLYNISADPMIHRMYVEALQRRKDMITKRPPSAERGTFALGNAAGERRAEEADDGHDNHPEVPEEDELVADREREEGARERWAEGAGETLTREGLSSRRL